MVGPTVFSIEEWHTRLLAHADGGTDPGLPPLPSRAIQEQFVGSSLRPAFEEAYVFYKTFVSYAAALAMPFDAPDARFLDFGCGWGRFLRYAMNQFPRERLLRRILIQALLRRALRREFQQRIQSSIHWVSCHFQTHFLVTPWLTACLRTSPNTCI